VLTVTDPLLLWRSQWWWVAHDVHQAASWLHWGMGRRLLTCYW